MQEINKYFPAAFVLVTMVLTFQIGQTFGQRDSLAREPIAVTARPSPDSIVLRWAPLDFRTWKWGNETGYRIERYTLVRNGILLGTPERVVLGQVFKPSDEVVWERLVKTDGYAAIAAQALFGDRFEIDLQQSDVISIVNKVQENEQRFAFALFSADMSPAVAHASGLWFTDRDVRPGEKYLYRIILNTSDSPRGSVFVGTDDTYELPKPPNLTAEFQDKVVALKWEKTKLLPYTAWFLERSKDGQKFVRTSDSPLVTVSPTPLNDTRYEYGIDSLPHPSATYHYRVRGITPFGEVGPPSNPVKGKAIATVAQVPYITSAINTENTAIDLRWDFPADNNDAINGFDIRRASEPNGMFKSLNPVLLSSERRNFTDVKPATSNYYQVVAYGKDGREYPSHVYFAHVIDSVPPSAPVGLEASVADNGEITVKWKKNDEADLYGYRVYKAYHRSEELAQITSEPLKEPSITDQVDVNTLNEHVYYSVMSIDNNQNHSSLSPLLKVSLPDKVKPQPPAILPVKIDTSGILISWQPGGSADIVRYDLYRKAPNEKGWIMIHSVSVEKDSLYMYRDVTVASGAKHLYTIISVDDSGLESLPATPVIGAVPSNALLPAVTWKKPKINREENALALAWNTKEKNVEAFRIFRASGDWPLTVYKTLKADQRELADILIPGKMYRYRIMAVFTNGQRSAMSEELVVSY